jgi:hypothetical protein
MKWLGKPMSGYVTGTYAPCQKEPRPLMRLAPANNSASNSESVLQNESHRV